MTSSISKPAKECNSMNSDEMTSTAYLQELYETTQGDTETQVSMYDIGIAMGVEKAEAGRIAEELMVQGYVELKTLAGGIGITDEGLKTLGLSPAHSGREGDSLRLSSGPIINDADRQIIEKITHGVKREYGGQAREYAVAEQAVLDLKVIELHLLSPSPKTAVLMELFHSLEQNFAESKTVADNSGLAKFITQNQ